MARQPAGVGSLLLSVLAGIGGFVLYFHQECITVEFLAETFCERPFENLGFMVLGFGMVLVILGIVLLGGRTKGE